VLGTKQSTGIRHANANDIDAITEIEKKCFPGPIAYSKRQLAYLALKAHSTCLIESQDGTVRGFIIVTYRKNSLVGSIETIGVDPTFQNQGAGLKLLTAAENDMKQQGMKLAKLEVPHGNTPAINLYQKAGYKLKETLRRYYRYKHSGTRDAIRMLKSL
jgi:ribosomal protein S18 acetylase RimI-like enzyme